MKFGGLLITRSTVWRDAPPGQLNTVDWVQPRSKIYARAALRRSVVARLGPVSLRLLSPEDFVVFKVLSTRDLDLEDAASVIRRNAGRLNLKWILATVRSLARTIFDHDLRARLDAAQRRSSD
jgi:hypothetical protein